jgi:hypothetical protein
MLQTFFNNSMELKQGEHPPAPGHPCPPSTSLSGVVAILSWCLLGRLGEEVRPRLGEGR